MHHIFLFEKLLKLSDNEISLRKLNVTLKMKGLIIIFMIIGSYAGSYLPVFWGENLFSITSIFLAAVGGFAGIWIGYKIANWMNLE